MNRLLSWLGQLVLLAVATFGFMVLYAHGTADFGHHASEEFGQLVNWMKGTNGAELPPGN